MSHTPRKRIIVFRCAKQHTYFFNMTKPVVALIGAGLLEKVCSEKKKIEE